MAEDNDLEKRAVEELLKETDRARVRAETMGPAGWLKCPLQSTNKRFLLNTLRSTSSQRVVEPGDGGPTAEGRGGRPRRDSPERGRRRSRTPPRHHRSNGGRSDHKHHHRDKEKKKKQDKDGERSYRHAGSRERRHRRDDGSRDEDKTS